MGVINTVEEILAITFQLPIVQDATQTKVERAISYQITNDSVRTISDSRQHHQLALTLTLRAENGYDSLGWMSARLAGGPSSGEEWRITAVGAQETVDYETKGEILISRAVIIAATIHHDQVKEVIKTINMEAQ